MGLSSSSILERIDLPATEHRAASEQLARELSVSWSGSTSLQPTPAEEGQGYISDI
jgi:hypothetical protein